MNENKIAHGQIGYDDLAKLFTIIDVAVNNHGTANVDPLRDNNSFAKMRAFCSRNRDLTRDGATDNEINKSVMSLLGRKITEDIHFIDSPNNEILVFISNRYPATDGNEEFLDNYGIIRAYHKEAIEYAFLNDAHVPDAVIDEYPDIADRYDAGEFRNLNRPRML